MARVTLVDIGESADPDVQAIHDSMVEAGRDWRGEHWRIEANFPAVMRHVLRGRMALWNEGDLPVETLEKIAVAVSVANGCTYCAGAFCTHLTDLGFETDEVAAFVRSVDEGSLDERDEVVIGFALQSLEDPQGVTDDQVDRLRDRHGLTDRDLVQVVYVVNFISGFNRIVDTFDAEYDHPFPRAFLEAAAEGD